jgi:hypothetical protein
MRLTSRVCNAMDAAKIAALAGSTCTTDAPFRETPEAIGAASRANILAVEMEAAALYAFAKARNRPVLCFAHVTNQLGRVEGDFEKGVADGAELSLQVIGLAVASWRAGRVVKGHDTPSPDFQPRQARADQRAVPASRLFARSHDQGGGTIPARLGERLSRLRPLVGEPDPADPCALR